METRVAAPPRPRRGYSVLYESRRRRGRDVDSQWRRAAAATWIVRGDGRTKETGPRPRYGYRQSPAGELTPLVADQYASAWFVTTLPKAEYGNLSCVGRAASKRT